MMLEFVARFTVHNVLGELVVDTREPENGTQYKAHVLCILELNTGSFYHAATSVLEPLDNV